MPACHLLIAGVILASIAACSNSAEPSTVAATVTPIVSSSPAPASTPTPAPTLRPGEVSGERSMPIVLHGPRSERRIALTFDADMTAGMRERLRAGRVDSYYNADLIEVLRRLEVPATLFLTGLWMQQYPDQTRDLAADDLFELGTHSQTHRVFTDDCYGLPVVPAEQMAAEVAEPVERLDSLDPDATRWFRFPGGCYDEQALRRAAGSGVTAVGTDVAAGDGFASSARAIADTVLAAARPGAIVTMHLHGGEITPLTDEAVALLVPALRERGYTLVTVTELLSR